MVGLRFALVLLCVFSATGGSKLPKTWSACKKSDKNRAECLRAAAQFAVRSMKDGNQALGVFPLDPMRFNTLQLASGSGPVNIKLDFKNLDLNGISTANVQKIKADWDNYYIEGNVTFGKDFVLLGDYTVSGRVLVLPITGAGKCNLTFENFSAYLTMKGHAITKGKHKHMFLDKFTVDIGTTRFIMKLDNLFNGDKALGDNMNVFLNENWRDILEELRPSISRGFGEGFRDVANRVFGKIPLQEIALR